MDNELVKKLTSKNQRDFEFAASQIINNSDAEAFNALVEKSDFLFDFIKENVKKRLSNAINQNNFRNLLAFLKIYSSDYEDTIISAFTKFADEEITDKMLEILEKGTKEEKTYAAKYFSKINDTLSAEFLQKECFSEFESLAYNCAEALGIMKDETSFNQAYEKLDSKDDFEKINALKFLVAYKAENLLKLVFETMKTSSMSENIAAEIPYIECFSSLTQGEYKNETLLAINYILNGFGEIIPLSQVFDFELFEVFENLASENDSKTAITLVNAKLKFEQLTENDEYVFDEDKFVKQEIYEIKNLLNSYPESFWTEKTKLLKEELQTESDFVYFALQVIQELSYNDSFKELENLLESKNQTVVLKTVEVLKSLDMLDKIDKEKVLNSITDENIKKIIIALF